MHYQMAMSVCSRRQDIQEQPNARFHRKAAPSTVDIDRFALDIFEHEIRVRTIKYARVNESGDVGMVEAPEYSPLAAEALLTVEPDPARVQELYRHCAFVPIVGAPGAPDTAHAAAPKFGLDDVGTYVTAHKARAAKALVRDEQRLRQKRREVITNTR